jgi:hypothetical protein
MVRNLVSLLNLIPGVRHGVPPENVHTLLLAGQGFSVGSFNTSYILE